VSVSSPAVCVRCAARGTSCCVSVEGIDGPPLTPGDEVRIAAASGLAPARFVSEREVDAVEEEAWAEEDPGLRGIVRGGGVRSIARQADGATCLFLAERGCALGEARPLACRRFPLVPVGARLEVRPAGRCLAVEEAGGLGELLALLGTSRRQLRVADAALRSELAPTRRQPRK